MANFIITEEQYNMLEADQKLQVDANKYAGSNPSQKLTNAQIAAQKAGVTDPNKVNFNVSGASSGSGSAVTTEGRVITKKEIAERQLRALRENSTLYSVENFLKR